MRRVVMSGCGRTFSKTKSVEDQAVLTLEDIQDVVGGKIGEELNCVEWHFSTDNFKSLCPLGQFLTSGCGENNIKVTGTVSEETAKVLQKWMNLNYSGVYSRASGTMWVRHPSGILKYRLSLSHIIPLGASFEGCRDDTSKVLVHMILSCGSFYLEERHESPTPLFVSYYPYSVLYRLTYKDHFTNKVIYEVFTSLEDAELRRDEVSDTEALISELCLSYYEQK